TFSFVFINPNPHSNPDSPARSKGQRTQFVVFDVAPSSSASQQTIIHLLQAESKQRTPIFFLAYHQRKSLTNIRPPPSRVKSHLQFETRKGQKTKSNRATRFSQHSSLHHQKS
ncbi:hypothetical protein V8G54_029597, partial [Vigna mungo]